MAEYTNLITFSLAFLAVLITLIAPIPIPEEQRLVVIATILLIFLAVILSTFNRRIDALEEKLKIDEQLINIKKDIEILKEKRS